MKRAREIRKFRVAVVQRRLIKEIYNSVRQVQSCCFAAAFSPLLLPSPSVNLPHNVIQTFCYYDNVTSHFSSLLASGINLLKSNVGSFFYLNKTALSSHPLCLP